MLAGWRHDRVLKGSLCNGERRQSAHASYYVPVPKRLKVMHSPDDSHGRYTVDRWRVMSPMTPYRWRPWEKLTAGFGTRLSSGEHQRLEAAKCQG